MDKKTFWEIIETAKKQSGVDMELRYEKLVSLLAQYEPEEILNFNEMAGVYIYAAEENLTVWAACKVIEGYASDDTFLYFCCWLVSQGYEIYSQAVKNPESLATDETGQYEYHDFEMLMGAAFEAYEKRTGQSPYELMETEPEMFDKRTEELSETLLKDIEFADDTPFRESEIEAKKQIPFVLPLLTARFGYDADAAVKEMEDLMTDPESVLENLREQLKAQGIDIKDLPGLEDMINGKNNQ